MDRGQEIVIPRLYVEEYLIFDFSRYTRHGPHKKIIPVSIRATRRNRNSRLAAANTMWRANNKLKITP